MTVTGVQKATTVVNAFLDTHFQWLSRPTIQEDPDWTTTRYHATKDNIFIPHYTDSWNEGKPEILIHELGHVLAWNSDRPIEGFLAAMGADPALLQFNLINEVFAEHFARAYVDGYDGHNYPALVNTVPFDAAKMRSFCETLRPIVPPTIVVTPPVTSREMYDSTNPYDIPVDVRMVAGYIDGWYRWPDDSWDRFPYAVKVRIAIHPTTKGAHVLDVEWGAASPADVPGWVVMSRADGIDPSVYVNRSNWQACKDACDAKGVAYPHWWVAAYGIGEVLLEGTVATQYANEAITGHHYDLSIVAPIWPGVEDDMSFTDDPAAIAYRKDVRDTFDAVKAVLAQLATQNKVEDGQLADVNARIDKLHSV